jgi:hypothetical protein
VNGSVALPELVVDLPETEEPPSVVCVTPLTMGYGDADAATAGTATTPATTAPAAAKRAAHRAVLDRFEISVVTTSLPQPATVTLCTLSRRGH